MDFTSLKQQAAVIRDENTDKQNTAERVGSLLIDMVTALARTMNAESARIDTTSSGATLVFTYLNDQDVSTEKRIPLPSLTSSLAGIVTPSQWQSITTSINAAISAEVTNRNSAIASAISNEVADRNSAIASAISDEVTNRNAEISKNTAKVGIVSFDSFFGTPTGINDSTSSAEGTVVFTETGVFLLKTGSMTNLAFYKSWPGVENYMTKDLSAPLSSKIFSCDGNYYAYNDGKLHAIDELLSKKVEALTTRVETLENLSKLTTATITNVNIRLGVTTVFASLSDALAALENGQITDVKKDGVVLSYLGDKGWKCKQFHGDTSTGWTTETNWKDFGGAGIAGVYNVSATTPLSSGYYKLLDTDNVNDSALHVVWASGKAVAGMIITFERAANDWKSYQYLGNKLEEAKWLDTDNWVDFGSLSKGSELMINIDNLIGAPKVGDYYTLSTALTRLIEFESTSGIKYRKKGLIISYAIAQNEVESKQYAGITETDFGEVGLWHDFGGGTKVELSDTPKKDEQKAFTTAGAYKKLPVGISVDDSETGKIKMKLVNEAGEDVTEEVQFPVGSGSGGGGSATILAIAFQNSPIYGAYGTKLVGRAAIVTTTNGTATNNTIETIRIIDRDTNLSVGIIKPNKRSQDALDDFSNPFLIDFTSYVSAAGSRRFKVIAEDDAGNSGSKNVNVTAVDVTVVSSQTLNYTASTVAYVGGNAVVIPMYKFPNNVSDMGILATTEIFLDGTWQTLGTATINNTYTNTISIDPKNCLTKVLSHGAYLLRIHGVDVATGVVGNYLYTTVMVVDKNSTSDIVAMRWTAPTEQATVKNYEAIKFDFAVYSPTGTIANVTIKSNKTGGTESIESTRTVARDTTYTFSKKIIENKFDGSITLSFYGSTSTAISSTATYVVSGTLLNISETPGEVFGIDFSERSNSESDKTIANNGVTMSVVGSNWTTNGFVKDSYGTADYGSESDTGTMTLRIAENVTANCSYQPFNDESIETNGMAMQFTMMVKNIADSSAKLIECINGGFGFYVTGTHVVFTTDNGATVAKTIKAELKEGERTHVCIVIEPTNRAPYSGIGAAKVFFDGEEVGACFYTEKSLTKHDAQISFNGTNADLYLYNLKAWKSYQLFQQAFDNYLLKMSDTTAMVAEYDFNNVMTSQTAEGNTKDRPQATSLYKLGIPYFVLCKNADMPDDQDKNNYPEYQDTLDGDKKTERKLDIYAYFPDRPYQDFKAIGVTVTNQGTTSSWRPIKNKKFKLKGSKITLLHTKEELNLSEADALKYDACAKNAAGCKVQILDSSVPTNKITVKVDYSESGGSNNGGSCELFNKLQRALGSNYMTPAQNSYVGTYTLNTSIDSIPCAFFRTDSKSPDATNPAYGYFHSKGNWNQDKGDAAVFGFEGVDGYNKKCLNYGNFKEFVTTRNQTLTELKTTILADTSALANGTVYVLSEFCGPNHVVLRNDGTGAFAEVAAVSDSEATILTITKVDLLAASVSSYNWNSVYKTSDGYYMQYKGGAWKETTGTMTFNTSAKTWAVTGDVMNPVENYEMLKYDSFDWFQGCNSLDDLLTLSTDGTPIWMSYFESRYPDDDNLKALYAAGKKVPYSLYKWLQFCQDCNQHLTEDNGTISLDGATVAGTKENRLKKWMHELHTVANVHSMLCYHVFTDYLAAVDQRSKNMMLGFYLDTDGKTRAYLNHLYDGDTINGSDNDCGLTVPAMIDPVTDKGVFQGWDSVLFQQNTAAEKIWLQDYISDSDTNTITLHDVADAMRKATDEKGQSLFSPSGLKRIFITDRLNRWPKIVSSFDGERKYIENSDSTENYFYALHGLRIKGLLNFIQKRFLYRDGFYRCGDLFSSAMGMRSTGTNMSVKIKAATEGFFALGVDRADVATDSVYLKAGETATLNSGATNVGSGMMLYLFGANQVSELDISGCTPSSSSWTIGELKLLRKFTIGGESYTPSNNSSGYLQRLDLGAMPYLEELDIRNTTITEVVATYCPRLTKLLAVGSLLESFQLAETSPINTLSLPTTLKQLLLVNLPSLVWTSAETSGLTIPNKTKIQRFRVENCPGINALTLLKTVKTAQSTSVELQFVRVTGLKQKEEPSLLNWIMSNNIRGINASGATPDEIGHCSGLLGSWEMATFNYNIQALKKYFAPELNVKQTEYTAIKFVEQYNGSAVTTDANIVNLENSTGYATGNAYAPSGHIKEIMSQRHRYLGKIAADGNMHIKQLDDTNSKKFATGEVATLDGSKGDVWMYEPKYWYKGVNDILHKCKYALFSSNEDKPTMANSGKSKTDYKIVNYADCIVDSGDTFRYYDATSATIVGTSDTKNQYKLAHVSFPAGQYKLIRFPSVLMRDSDHAGYMFVDANKSILKRNYLDPTTEGFVNGMYLIETIPSTATDLYFTIDKNSEPDNIYLVNSDNVLDCEPEWAYHEHCLVGATHAGWKGNDFLFSGELLARAAASDSTTNYTTFAANRGFQLIDFEIHKDIANLFFAQYGRKNSQAVCGNVNDNRVGYSMPYGMTDTYTQTSTAQSPLISIKATDGSGTITPKVVNFVCALGYENLYADLYEWMDKNRSSCPNSNATDVGKIYSVMPDGTTRKIRPSLTTGNANYMVHQLYMDLVSANPTKPNTDYSAFYTDYFGASVGAGRVLARSGGGAGAMGGVSCIDCGYDSSYAGAVYGTRLAFRPSESAKIVKVENASEFDSDVTK